MQKAKRGDVVNVHYKGTLDDGTEFDSSDGSDPIQFTIGNGDVILGFEEAIIGMTAGESKTERFVPERAYGNHKDDLVFTIPREQLPKGTEISIGDSLRIGFADGGSAAVQVTAMNAKQVTLDANHPLAGKPLTFELTLVSIE
jgi:FKBP-type peptidyl-prolyl cis-trans isomerase 2